MICDVGWQFGMVEEEKGATIATAADALVSFVCEANLVYRQIAPRDSISRLAHGTRLFLLDSDWVSGNSLRSADFLRVCVYLVVHRFAGKDRVGAPGR